MEFTEHAIPWSRYIAIGDSFTEGLWDSPTTSMPAPQEDERLGGWADRLATVLSARRIAAGQDPIEYANFAIRGRLSGQILREQLPVALAYQPDLVSLIAGPNDIMRPKVDVDAMSVAMENAVINIRATGADVLLATGVDVARSPLVSLTRNRVALYNANLWSIARRHGAFMMDLWGMKSTQDWRMWSEDRIHPNSEGHRRITQGALVGLGLAVDDPSWDVPLDELPAQHWRERTAEDAQWAKEYLYPWATRRLRKKSSGDLRHPKDNQPQVWGPAT